MEQETSIFIILLIAPAIPGTALVVLSFFFYIPYFRNIMKNVDPNMYRSTGNSRLVSSFDFHWLAPNFLYLSRNHPNQRIKKHAKALCYTFSYPLLYNLFLVVVLTLFTYLEWV